MPDDRSATVIETVADGLRLQVGDLPGDYAPKLLKAKAVGNRFDDRGGTIVGHGAQSN